MLKSLLLLLAAAVLISVRAGSATADHAGGIDNVAIVTCQDQDDDNMIVLGAVATFTLPSTCLFGTFPPQQCAPCLRDLIREAGCEAGNYLSSNIQTLNPTSTTPFSSIQRFAFVCD